MDKLLGNLQCKTMNQHYSIHRPSVDLVDASLYLSIGWIIHDGDTALLGRLQ